MPHIALTEELPGIRGPMVFSPETTKPLCDLVQALLTGPHTLSLAEREMIATYVSSETIATTASIATARPPHSILAENPRTMNSSPK